MFIENYKKKPNCYVCKYKNGDYCKYNKKLLDEFKGVQDYE